jgi:hypothetical protein
MNLIDFITLLPMHSFKLCVDYGNDEEQFITLSIWVAMKKELGVLVSNTH